MAASTPITIFGNGNGNNVVTAVSNVPQNGSSGAFPADLEKQPFWMSFSFYSYSMPDLTNQNSLNLSDQGTIRLPLPNTMTDSQNVEYSTEDLGLVAGMALNGLRQGGAAGLTTATLGAVAGFTGTANDINRLTNNNIAAGIGQTQGVAVNPFLTVMFKQPAFKQHQFLWKLTPSNEPESQKLNTIINTFRGNMLPDYAGSSGGTLLTYPNIVQITISVNDPNYFTYVFKPAVIQSFNVNFAPSGQPSFFGNTRAPTEVEIQMQILEIEYWLSSDFGINTTINPVGTFSNWVQSTANAAIKAIGL
jgi:hypothetical protein